LTRTEIVEFCRSHGTVLETCAAIARGIRFDHPSIVGLAKNVPPTFFSVIRCRKALFRSWICGPCPNRFICSISNWTLQKSRNSVGSIRQKTNIRIPHAPNLPIRDKWYRQKTCRPTRIRLIVHSCRNDNLGCVGYQSATLDPLSDMLLCEAR